MAEVTATLVRQLREETNLPMMDCKQALTENGGDKEAAKEWLRKKGLKIQEGRGGRETAFGRFGIYTGVDKPTGAIVEVKCESAPVAGSAEFIQFANDLAQQLATGPGAATADELLDQPSPSQKGKTLREVKDEMFNRIREVFNVGRLARLEGGTGGYSHNSGTVSGVLVAVEGGTDEAAKDVSMHIAAMRPLALNTTELDPAVVDKERTFLREAGPGRREAREHRRQDGRRPAKELLRRTGPARTAVRQGKQPFGRQVCREQGNDGEEVCALGTGKGIVSRSKFKV
jgi:elongation factor Ts